MTYLRDLWQSISVGITVGVLAGYVEGRYRWRLLSNARRFRRAR